MDDEANVYEVSTQLVVNDKSGLWRLSMTCVKSHPSDPNRTSMVVGLSPSLPTYELCADAIHDMYDDLRKFVNPVNRPAGIYVRSKLLAGDSPAISVREFYDARPSYKDVPTIYEV